MNPAKKARNKGRTVLCCGALAFGLAFAASFGEDTSRPAMTGGPPIPGVCVLSREAVFDLSKVGQDVMGQFRIARDTAQRQVSAEEGRITADVRDLEAQKSSLTEELYRQRQLELGGRLQELRAEAAKRSQQLEEARQAAVKKIADAVQPSIAAVYQRYRCSLLLSRDAVLAGNPGMDVTAEVIKGLDGAITQMPFYGNRHD